MTEKSQKQLDLTNEVEFKPLLPSRRAGFKLFCQLIIYHLMLVVAVVLLVVLFPSFASQLPVGGVTELVGSGEATVAFENTIPSYSDDSEIVSTVVKVAGQLDRLGYARQLTFVLPAPCCCSASPSWRWPSPACFAFSTNPCCIG